MWVAGHRRMQVARFERFAGGVRFERIVEMCAKVKSPTRKTGVWAARSGRKGRRSSLGWVGVSSMAAGLRASQDPSRHVGRGSEKQIPRSARDDTGRRGE